MTDPSPSTPRSTPASASTSSPLAPFQAAAADAAALTRRAGIAAFDVAVVLGSGLGAFADALDDATRFPMTDLPGFPRASVAGHAGEIVIGRLGGHHVLVLAGRVHLYEGRTVHEVCHGVRVAAQAGAPAVVLTNAAGGIRDDLAVGSLVRVSDHVNLSGANPLAGAHDGPQPTFVDMSAAYDPELRALAETVLPGLAEGVYASLPGPTYETPAEIRMLAAIGADLVGMSTACEAIALRHLGVRVAGVSLVTNRAAGLGEPLSHEEVTAVGRAAADDIVAFLSAYLPAVAETTAGAIG
ncbi:MAG: purine-nucleoside phosphorylase [Acidimicrobiales bacterium]